MIYIDLENNPPSQDWIDMADIVTQELVDTVDSVLRNQIIDANQPLWNELKNHLSSLNNDKCWYTESINSGAHCHVDHFRPKKEVIDENGVKTEGYWWLAFFPGLALMLMVFAFDAIGHNLEKIINPNTGQE